MRSKFLRFVTVLGLMAIGVALPVAGNTVAAAPSLSPATQTSTASVGVAMTATAALVST